MSSSPDPVQDRKKMPAAMKSWGQVSNALLTVFDGFEKKIVVVLAFLMAITVLAATWELVVVLFNDLTSRPFFILELGELLSVFGFFLMILLGLELLETFKAYLREDVIHVEVVFVVAMMAIARKVIILDVKELSGLTLIGLAALIVSLAGGYFLIRRVHASAPDQPQDPSPPKTLHARDPH